MTKKPTIVPTADAIREGKQLNIPDELWTSAEVAAYLRVTSRMVTSLAMRGEIPAFRVGTYWRFHKSDIMAHGAPARMIA